MKVSIIGLGMVGKEVLHYLIHFSEAKEIVVLDLNQEKAQAEINDFVDTFSLKLNKYAPKIYLGDFKNIKESDFIIINASITQTSSDRNLLAKGNIDIVKSLALEIDKYAENSFVIITSNPLDTIVYAFQHFSQKIPSHKVIGTGTFLDTIRLQYYLANFYQVSTDAVQGYVLGEHGASCFIPWSLMNIFSVPYKSYEKLNQTASVNEREVLDYVVQRGLSIFKARKYTDHGIGACVYALIDAIWYNSNTILPVASLLNNYHGLNDVVLSAPSLLNRNGVEKLIHIPLNEDEVKKYKQTAEAVKNLHTMV